MHLHAWLAGFYLGLISSQVISMTAGSIMPRRTHRSDKLGRPRSPISGCPTCRKQRQCNATRRALKHKGGKGGLHLPLLPTKGRHRGQQIQSSTTDYGSSPRAEQDVPQDVLREGRRSERKASSPKVCCKNRRIWKPDKIFQTRPGMMACAIRAGPHELHENR